MTLILHVAVKKIHVLGGGFKLFFGFCRTQVHCTRKVVVADQQGRAVALGDFDGFKAIGQDVVGIPFIAIRGCNGDIVNIQAHLITVGATNADGSLIATCGSLQVHAFHAAQGFPEVSGGFPLYVHLGDVIDGILGSCHFQRRKLNFAIAFITGGCSTWAAYDPQ